jgi:hypothetical protein
MDRVSTYFFIENILTWPHDTRVGKANVNVRYTFVSDIETAWIRASPLILSIAPPKQN